MTLILFLSFKLCGAGISSVKQGCPSPQPEGKVAGLGVSVLALTAPKKNTFPLQFPARNSVQPWPFHIQQTLSSHIPSLSLLGCFPAIPPFILLYFVLLCLGGSPSQLYPIPNLKVFTQENFIKTSPGNLSFFIYLFSPPLLCLVSVLKLCNLRQTL